VAEWQTRMP